MVAKKENKRFLESTDKTKVLKKAKLGSHVTRDGELVKEFTFVEKTKAKLCGYFFPRSYSSSRTVELKLDRRSLPPQKIYHFGQKLGAL